VACHESLDIAPEQSRYQANPMVRPPLGEKNNQRSTISHADHAQRLTRLCGSQFMHLNPFQDDESGIHDPEPDMGVLP
jgi:hypothetical protein